MRKIIMVVEMPEDCYDVSAEISCSGYGTQHISEIFYNEREVDLRERAYDSIADDLALLGIN